MIRETITFNFDTPEQQKAFHERLNTHEPADDDATAVLAARDRMAGIVQRAVLAEREACAKLADRHVEDAEHLTQAENTAILIAADIRARR